MLACEFTKQKLAVFFLSHPKYSKFNEPRLKGVFSFLRRKVIGESKMHNIFQKGFCSMVECSTYNSIQGAKPLNPAFYLHKSQWL